MSDFQVLARKWRPAQFDAIVGQAPVVRALMNAIGSDRVHHAYLFTGSRGIGKTSIARIVSKALRCQALVRDPSGIRSCDKCSDCLEIASGRSVDVMEIDGASNNGVDAVREIREGTTYMPSSGSRKIYIIDEVHMLTTAAFNALLKTLEEPPAHVVFIFATTEAQKIPATILSRCQRFDFKRVGAGLIQSRLEQILQAEGIAFESTALSAIARAADGSMRDALSILDQVIAFSGAFPGGPTFEKGITLEAARESVGLIEFQTVHGMLSGVLGRDSRTALSIFNAVYERGQDMRVLLRAVVEALHDLLLLELAGQEPAGVSASELESLQALRGKRPVEELEMIFQAFHHAVDLVARNQQPKIYIDVLLMKLAHAEGLVRVADLVRAKPEQVAPASPAVSPALSVQAPVAKPKTWEGFIAHIQQARPLLASLLEHAARAEPPTATQAILRLTYTPENDYKAAQLKAKVYSDALKEFCKIYFGLAAHVLVGVSDATDASTGAPPTENLAERKRREKDLLEEQVRDRVTKHPVINEAQALFGAKIGEIVMEGRTA